MDQAIAAVKYIVRIYYSRVKVRTNPSNEYDVKKEAVYAAILNANPRIETDVLFNNLFPAIFGIVHCEYKLSKN